MIRRSAGASDWGRPLLGPGLSTEPGSTEPEASEPFVGLGHVAVLPGSCGLGATEVVARSAAGSGSPAWQLAIAARTPAMASHFVTVAPRIASSRRPPDLRDW